VIISPVLLERRVCKSAASTILCSSCFISVVIVDGTTWLRAQKRLDGTALVGADSHSGLVHSASVTAGNVHDSHELPNLLHGEETRLYGDSAYRGQEQRKRLQDSAPRARDFTNQRAYKNRPLTEADKQSNRRKSAVRSKVEHPFLTLKRLWGFAKTRYRGLAKNANRAYAMLALINVSKWNRPLTGEVSAL